MTISYGKMSSQQVLQFNREGYGLYTSHLAYVLSKKASASSASASFLHSGLMSIAMMMPDIREQASTQIDRTLNPHHLLLSIAVVAGTSYWFLNEAYLLNSQRRFRLYRSDLAGFVQSA